MKAADKVKVEYKKATLAPVHTIEEVLHHAGNRIHATENKSMRVVPFARLVSATKYIGGDLSNRSNLALNLEQIFLIFKNLFSVFNM